MAFLAFVAVWVVIGLSYEMGRSYERKHGKSE